MSVYTYRAQVNRVVDGDTVDLDWIDLGFGMSMRPIAGDPLRLRLAYVNAYETSLRGDTTVEQKSKGLEAKAWLASEIEGKTIRIRTVRGGERGSFGRLLVWLWPDGIDDEVLDDATSYNHELIRRGYGVVYEP